jgi:hypothetical protein
MDFTIPRGTGSHIVYVLFRSCASRETSSEEQEDELMKTSVMEPCMVRKDIMLVEVIVLMEHFHQVDSGREDNPIL